MDLEKFRILIVDDEIFNLQFLTELLISDYSISPAKDGPHALRLADSLVPDLIIMDVVMPGMDGYQVIRDLKANHKTRHIPVIFLTSLDSTKDEEKGLLLGALDYIRKPFQPAIVKARINNILDLVQQRKLLEKIALLDGLTGIPNRRSYDDRLHSEWQRAYRNGKPFSLALLDIDYFKQYNDTYGHGPGDMVLKKVGRTLSHLMKRSSDFAARYGGEEFALILPSLPFHNGQAFASMVCREIIALGIEHTTSKVEKILTVSIGGATTLPAGDHHYDDFTRHVDKMLYQAKRTRNQAVWSFFLKKDEKVMRETS